MTYYLQGAEREVRLPQEISRFQDLPMTVTYIWLENGTEKKDTKVLQAIEADSNEVFSHLYTPVLLWWIESFVICSQFKAAW